MRSLADNSPGEQGTTGTRPAREGLLKLYFTYAQGTGATTELLEELQVMVGQGKDVYISEMVMPSTGNTVGTPFDLDYALKRRPDLVALDNFAALNAPSARNRHRYQDALELMRAGIDVHAVLRVDNLESEQERLLQITGTSPSELVPDRMFYHAQQVEFVDVDPQELTVRIRAQGRTPLDVDVLHQLRSLALECFSYYVSQRSDLAEDKAAAAAGEDQQIQELPGTLPERLDLPGQDRAMAEDPGPGTADTAGPVAAGIASAGANHGAKASAAEEAAGPQAADVASAGKAAAGSCTDSAGTPGAERYTTAQHGHSHGHQPDRPEHGTDPHLSYAEGAFCPLPPAASGREGIVVLVSPGESPKEALMEARTLARLHRASIQVVLVRSGQGRLRSTDTQDKEAEAACTRLSSYISALGYDLSTLWGDDPTAALRDYLRIQGARDIVVSAPLYSSLVPSTGRRRARALQDSFGGARVHVVPGVAQPLVSQRSFVPGLRSLADFRLADLAVALLAMLLALATALLFYRLGIGGASYPVYILASTLVAWYSRSYLPSIVCFVLCCLVETTCILPWYGINLRLSGVIVYVIMALVLSLVCCIAVGMGRSAGRAKVRERNTQAIYELGRSLSFAHGIFDVVDVSLDTIVHLFDRSVAFYTADPMQINPDIVPAAEPGRTATPGRDSQSAESATASAAAAAEGSRAASFARAAAKAPAQRKHNLPAVRIVPGDVPAEEFERITERNIAHWVFTNAEEAGAGTDTSSTSRIIYLPLLMDSKVIGVVALSLTRPFAPGERDFLSLVLNQVLGAFEKQALAASHKGGLRAMRVAAVRSEFLSTVVKSVSQASETMSNLMRIIQTGAEPGTIYGTAVEELAGMEARRERMMIDRIMADVVSDSHKVSCDVQAEVQAVVDNARQGLESTRILMEPPAGVAAITADPAMVRTAAELVLEASLSFAPVGSVITVGVNAHPDYITVSVADDRPDALSAPLPAFSREYDSERARRLLAYAGDRAAVEDDADSSKALAEALGVPLAACMKDGRADLRRVARIDRVQYGLYVAALIVRAYKGNIRMRHRLGGGSVTVFTLPLG